MLFRLRNSIYSDAILLNSKSDINMRMSDMNKRMTEFKSDINIINMRMNDMNNGMNNLSERIGKVNMKMGSLPYKITSYVFATILELLQCLEHLVGA